MATMFWHAISLKKLKKSFVVAVFRSFYGVFIHFNYFWADFEQFFLGFGQIQKSKMADQDGRHSEMITQLLRHVTSSPYDANIKGDIFRHTIYPPILVVIAFIFSELQRGQIPPTLPPFPPIVEDQKQLDLNRVKGRNL